jgi:hypothetical protein
MKAHGRTWKKSSRTQGANNCVELAYGEVTLVRDSKNPDGPQLRVSLGALVQAVKADRLAG